MAECKTSDDRFRSLTMPDAAVFVAARYERETLATQGFACRALSLEARLLRRANDAFAWLLRAEKYFEAAILAFGRRFFVPTRTLT